MFLSNLIDPEDPMQQTLINISRRDEVSDSRICEDEECIAEEMMNISEDRYLEHNYKNT